MAEPGFLPDFDDGLLVWPETASAGAGTVDALFYGLLTVCGAMTLAVVVLVAWFGWRYRAGSRARRSPPLSEGRTRALEIGWSLVLLTTFLGLFAWATTLYLDMYRDPPGDALTINVIGKQWMWKLQHPDGTREINTLHVPAGRRVRLRITSQDVIHSFFVPAFRLKRDAVPGMYSTMWFEATEPGEYRLFCAEYCGTDHALMRGKVVVLPAADYQAWLEENGTGPAPAVAGRNLFRAHGCSGCHQGDSQVRAPSLAGVFGRTVPLAGGGTVRADEAYLRDSILRPNKHVVAGYRPVMPSFQGQISEDEVLQVIAYLKSLEPGDWEDDL